MKISENFQKNPQIAVEDSKIAETGETHEILVRAR